LAHGESRESRSLRVLERPGLATYDELVRALGETANDLETPAVRLRDEVRRALAALGERPGADLVRMSGSGATCFALFRDCGGAARSARRLREDHPAWWVKSVALR
jgi:4-diphosphocytidyl-2-C-methyl-D-erythritol kinase